METAVRTLLRLLRGAFEPFERLAYRLFGGESPFHHLGALTIYLFWVVLVSGLYVFAFYETSVAGAYASVERLTHEQWYLGGVMRSLHRYASDAAVLTLGLHILRELSRDHHRGPRWFSWLTGVPNLWMVYMLGITGYWMVWDELAQYVAVATAELLDWLPIFTDPMARNFLTEGSLSDRFFTLLAFLHLLGLPLILVGTIWLHIQRISRPRIHPPRRLAAGTLLALLALSLVQPATSHGPADLTREPQVLHLDWFYLPVYPLYDLFGASAVWGLLWGGTLLLCALPWLPRRRRVPVAEVDPAWCNGCRRCFSDCPYGAIDMAPHPDKRGKEISVVDPALCVSCGICEGACPSATPFRSVRELVSGIELPQYPVQVLRERARDAARRLRGSVRIVVFGCGHAADLASVARADTAAVPLECAAMLPPSLVEYLIRREGVDGVVIAGCRAEDCEYRLGTRWVEERIAGAREPHLRRNVPRERVALCWAGTDAALLRRCVEDFRARLARAAGAGDDEVPPAAAAGGGGGA